MARWLLRVDLAGRALAQPGELVAGGRDVLLAGLRRDLLGAVEDLVGLAPGLLEGGVPLLLGRFAVASRLLGVLAAPARSGRAGRRGSCMRPAERDALDDQEEARRSWPRRR